MQLPSALTCDGKEVCVTTPAYCGVLRMLYYGIRHIFCEWVAGLVAISFNVLKHLLLLIGQEQGGQLLH